jgi:hypothetical protein
MSCDITLHVVRGRSGRVIIELDTNLKDALYGQLKADGLTLKEWFIRRVAAYLEGDVEGRQLDLWRQSGRGSSERGG